MKRLFLISLMAFGCLQAATQAQQGGLNTSVLPGLPADPDDPLAQYKSDVLEQRQVEADILASTRNHLHLLSFFNDYRAVDIADDAGQAGVFASGGLKGVLERVVAWVTGRKPEKATLPVTECRSGGAHRPVAIVRRGPDLAWGATAEDRQPRRHDRSQGRSSALRDRVRRVDRVHARRR